jgi:hypothetical protein
MVGTGIDAYLRSTVPYAVRNRHGIGTVPHLPCGTSSTGTYHMNTGALLTNTRACVCGGGRGRNDTKYNKEIKKTRQQKLTFKTFLGTMRYCLTVTGKVSHAIRCFLK